MVTTLRKTVSPSIFGAPVYSWSALASKLAQTVIDKGIDKAIDKDIDKAIDKAIDKDTDKAIDKATDKASEKAAIHHSGYCQKRLRKPFGKCSLRRFVERLVYSWSALATKPSKKPW